MSKNICKFFFLYLKRDCIHLNESQTECTTLGTRISDPPCCCIILNKMLKTTNWVSSDFYIWYSSFTSTFMDNEWTWTGFKNLCLCILLLLCKATVLLLEYSIPVLFTFLKKMMMCMWSVARTRMPRRRLCRASPPCPLLRSSQPPPSTASSSLE